ncbi:MAG TPA: acylneuraminate cytidylyltransferase family protein [Terriglobales bacterium]|nr:acylneuraminate cytidylyltransferase family protein [Terriglobales bacterium]
MQKILGWIPARWHSKGVPGKNKRVLGDQPLIVHAILSAQQAACLDRIVVSTDDPDIAQLAREAQADVPWMRPPELAADDSPVIESAIYDLERLKVERNYCPDAVMLLQPTSPYRSPETIRAAQKMFVQAEGESVVSVTPAREHPHWCQRIAQDGTLEAFSPEASQPLRRQALIPAYHLAGVVYVASIETILSKRSFYSSRTKALVISSEKEALDIDTPFDWRVAEALWNYPCAGETA